METARRQPLLKEAAFRPGHRCCRQMERALHKSHTWRMCVQNPLHSMEVIVNQSLSHQAVIGRSPDKAITYLVTLVTEQLLWVLEVLYMCVGACVSCNTSCAHAHRLALCLCCCGCVVSGSRHVFACYSRQQMELHANWVEISGGSLEQIDPRPSCRSRAWRAPTPGALVGAWAARG